MSFADKISSVRIILIPVFVSLLIYSETYPLMHYFAVSVFVLAILSDFFDGMVARLKKEKSELGQIIDPLADKLLLLTAFIALFLLDWFGYLWLVLIVVSRDLILVFGFLVGKMLKVEMVISPTLWGKLTTFSQMLTVLWILCKLPHNFYVSIIAATFTLISGLDYFLRGLRVINAQADSTSY